MTRAIPAPGQTLEYILVRDSDLVVLGRTWVDTTHFPRPAAEAKRRFVDQLSAATIYLKVGGQKS